MGFQIVFLVPRRNFNETDEIIKQKIVDIFSKYKVDLLIYLLICQTVQMKILTNSILSINSLTKVMKKSYLHNVLHSLYTALLKKSYDLLNRDIETFIMKALGHFSVSSKCTEAPNEFFAFTEVEGQSLFTQVPMGWESLLPAMETVLKCWPAIKSYFPSVEQEECPSLIWKYVEDKNGENDHSETDVYMLFLPNCLMVFGGEKELRKDRLTAPELFGIMYRLSQELIRGENDSFFGSKSASELKKKCQRLRAAKLNKTF